MKRDAQCKSSKGDSVVLHQGDYIRTVERHWLPRDHPFVNEWCFDNKTHVAAMSGRGMVLIRRDDIEWG
jgi:hypothetical protein